MLENNPVVVLADPLILSADYQPKFRIIENDTIRKKEKKFKHNIDSGNVLESEIIKFKQTDFLKALNVLQI